MYLHRKVPKSHREKEMMSIPFFFLKKKEETDHGQDNFVSSSVTIIVNQNQKSNYRLHTKICINHSNRNVYGILANQPWVIKITNFTL